MSSHWLTDSLLINFQWGFSFLLIGRCYCFAFGFTTLNRKGPKSALNETNENRMYSVWYRKVFRGSVTVYKEILCQSVDTAKRASSPLEMGEGVTAR